MTPAVTTAALRATAQVLADHLPSQASVIGQALRLLERGYEQRGGVIRFADGTLLVPHTKCLCNYTICHHELAARLLRLAEQYVEERRE